MARLFVSVLDQGIDPEIAADPDNHRSAIVSERCPRVARRHLGILHRSSVGADASWAIDVPPATE
jgi:hypothetical protein